MTKTVVYAGPPHLWKQPCGNNHGWLGEGRAVESGKPTCMEFALTGAASHSTASPCWAPRLTGSYHGIGEYNPCIVPIFRGLLHYDTMRTIFQPIADYMGGLW